MWLCKPRIPKTTDFNGDLENLTKIRKPIPCGDQKASPFTLEFKKNGTAEFLHGMQLVQLRHSPKQENSEMMVLRGTTISISNGVKLTYMIKIPSMIPPSPQTPGPLGDVTHVASLYIGVYNHPRRQQPLLIRDGLD
jgi:hypothetical protein